jgi:hypothetical protein
VIRPLGDTQHTACVIQVLAWQHQFGPMLAGLCATHTHTYTHTNEHACAHAHTHEHARAYTQTHTHNLTQFPTANEWSSYDRTCFSGPDKQEILILSYLD